MSNNNSNTTSRNSKSLLVGHSYPFLKDFNARTLSLAVPYSIARYSVDNILSYRDGTDITSEIFYQLVHMVLLFIEDKAVKSEDCTMDDITDMLQDVIQVKLGLEFNAFRDLAVDIIHNVFLNKGKRLYYNSFDNASDTLKSFEIDLITEKFSGTGNKATSLYGLTPQGFKYIYLTKELEDLSEVEIDQIKLIKAIKQGNFKSARVNADSLYQKVEIQRQIIEYNKKNILNQVAFENIDDLLKTINESYDLINSQCAETKSILNMIKEFHDIDKDTNIVMWQKVQNGLEDINYIDSKLYSILDKQWKLVIDTSDLIKLLQESLMDVSFMSVDNKFNVFEDIIKPLEQETTGEFNPFSILKGLFTAKIPKKFSLNQVLGYQEIFNDEKQTDKYSLEYAVDLEEEADNSELLKIEEFNRMYEELFIIILEKVLKEGIVSLQDIVDEYDIFSKNIPATKVVLVTLFNEKEIYLGVDPYIASVETVENFSPSMIASKYNYNTGKCKFITYRKDKSSIIISSSDEDFADIIKVPNMIFTIRKED